MLGLLRFFIRIYQCTFSPFLSLICGPGSGCRFKPTCSAYFLGAVETHGISRGSWLGLKRLGRCHPWGGAGHDPVPARESLSAAKEAGKLKSSPTIIRSNLDCVCE